MTGPGARPSAALGLDATEIASATAVAGLTTLWVIGPLLPGRCLDAEALVGHTFLAGKRMRHCCD